jgi:signal transduction histidine kinase/ActR/RegA family two-component response regulator
MIPAALSENEEIRLKELYSLDLLDTESETDFDEIVQLASYICKCDIALMSLVDINRQWFKAKRGMTATETPREISFCAHAILQKGVFIVEDALADQRFFDNPFVIEGGIRFYAGAPIETENNLPIGTICVADTNPRHLDKEQIAALSKLARQAGILIELKRKNELLKEQALQEQILKEKAEKASRAQEQFLSTMSHEIRTPLNGVIGMIELLSQNSPRPDQINNIDLLRTSSANLLNIVNDILDYNKIESGKLKIEKTNFNLNETISEIKKIHELKAKQKGIQFEILFDSKIPETVCGDPARLKQILNNLTDNAIKFTITGFVRINVELQYSDSEKSSVFFKVQDTGIGIEADKIQNIFDRFFQANANTTRIFDGTGLGLAITKKLLELMNSEINVQSGKDRGSCFSFLLDFDVATQKTLSLPNISYNTREGNLDDLKILVVEDNKINKMVIEQFLKKWNVKADFAWNGLEAVEKASKQEYDLILMDLHMPEMNGYEATAFIRNELKKNMPIIAITADTLFDADNKINKQGLTDYILKPVNPKKLYNKIYDNTAGSKSSR